MDKPHVLFAIGDADWHYTRGKIRHLVERVASRNLWQVSVASHSEEICQAFTTDWVQTLHLPGKRLPLSLDNIISMTDLMIRFTRDVVLPESQLPIWKVIAMDDYLASLDVITYSALPVKPDIVVYPLMGVDNNTIEASHFYSTILLEARKAQAPILGLEVSLFGNRQTLGASLADYYALKNENSRSFALSQEITQRDKVFILSDEERYLLTTREDKYLTDFFAKENTVRERLTIPEDHVVIFIPHSVAFIYETRRILANLRSVKVPCSIILCVDPNLARHGLKEREIVQKAYHEELSALPHVIIDDAGAWLWSILLADVVIAPAWSVFTEVATSYGKLTVINHTWGERGWVGDNLFVEPYPERAILTILAWIEKRILQKRRISTILQSILDHSRTPIQEETRHAA
jgi:hypothetical protein